MMIRSRLLSAAVLLMSSAALAVDPPKQQVFFDPAKHLRTSEIRAGMCGYGLSVFSGTKIDKFDVEVISVMHNEEGAKHDVILVRTKGMGLEHSGTAEGMSGSPVYLKDDAGNYRLAGAVALAWEYSKDPIAGVRPIEEMLDVPTTATLPASTVKVSSIWNASKMIARYRHPTEVKASAADNAQLRPLALPLAMGGVDRNFFEANAPRWSNLGLAPLQAASAGGASDPADANAKIEPGAAIALPVVTGDLSLAAIGTVTEVIGDHVWAFGHEFNGDGNVDLPMGVGRIDTVIASSQISMKFGSLLKLSGTISNDESTAIAGTLGKIPAMIPIDVTVHTAQRDGQQTYHFEAVKHPKLTTMGVSTALASAVMGHSNLPHEFTIRYTMKMQFAGGQSVNVANTATSANQAPELSRDLSLPLALLMDNPFAREYPEKISADFTVEPAAHVAVIRSVTSDKTIYKPGDTANLYVTTIDWQGGQTTRTIQSKIPDGLDDGQYQLTVGDADRFLGDEVRFDPYRFEARSIDEVFGLIKQITDRPTTRLYTRLTAMAEGISVGRTPLKSLPASRLKLLSLAGRGDVMPFVESVTQQLDWGEPLSGSGDLVLAIAADPSKAVRPKAMGAAPMVDAPQAPQQTPPPQKDEGDQGN